MAKILVTGGFGYVGSRLTPHLLEKGHHVRVLDALFYTTAGLDVLKKDSSFPEWEKRFEFIQGDIRNPLTVEQAVKDMDVVIHLAAIANDPACEMDEIVTRQVNFDATGCLLHLTRAAGVKRFIFASTHSVLGMKDEGALSEKHEPEPLTIYPRYKMLAEWLVFSNSSPDFCTTTLRPATTCGISPRQRLDLTVNNLVANAARKKTITIHATGEQKRPSVAMADVINAYAQLVEADPALINGRTFNFGFENPRVIDVAEMVRKEFADDFDVSIQFSRATDPRNYHVSSEKITQALNYQPASSTEQEIAQLRRALTDGHCADINEPRYYNARSLKISRMPSCYQLFSR